MKLIKYISPFLFIFFISTGFSYAQKTNDITYDTSSPVEIRTSDKINNYLNDEQFLYDKKIVKAPESRMQKILNKILRFIADIFRLIDEGGNAVSVIFYIIIFGILLFVIIKLLGFKYQGLFIRSKQIKGSEIEVFDEDIHEIDFDAMINNALEMNNYSLAVRYLYIKFLKVLTDRELIEWEKNKTNKDYYKEMKKTAYFSVFKRLTFVYEYVWYGEFPINRIQFEDYKMDFSKIYKEIS